MGATPPFLAVPGSVFPIFSFVGSEVFAILTTEDTENIVEENSEESDNVEKQLKALIKESQKKRENWNRVTCLEENG